MDDNVSEFPGKGGISSKVEHGSSVAQNFITMPPDTLKPFFWYLLGSIIFASFSLAISTIALAYSIAKAEYIGNEAGRAQRQADLANWTMMNLEAEMMKHDIPVAESLRPKNLGPQPKEINK